MQHSFNPQSASRRTITEALKRYTVPCLVGMSLLSGCGQKQSSGDASIKGVKNYDFRIAGGIARLSIAFTDLHMDAGAVIPLNRPVGASVEIGPDFNSGGILFVISVPLSGLVNGSMGLPYLGLPDGRALPDVRTGTVQGTAAQLPLFGLTYLYVGQDVFGIFLPVALPDTYFIVRSRMRDELGNTLGYIYGIPKSNAKQISGVLVLLPIEGSQTAAELSDSVM